MVKVLLGAVVVMALSGAVAYSQQPEFTVKHDWYRWVDQKYSDRRYSPPAMSGHNVGSRCLCGPGDFIAVMSGEGRFRIVRAPDGYNNTVGKEFFYNNLSLPTKPNRGHQ
jgi:hypothetical protein